MNDSVIATILILGTPAAAVVGGIVAGILRMLGRQRLIELALRERIAAIERGIDVRLLPPLPLPIENAQSQRDSVRRKAQGFQIGGLLTLGIGLGLIFMLSFLPHGQGRDAWGIGFVPTFLGIALLLCARVVRASADEE